MWWNGKDMMGCATSSSDYFGQWEVSVGVFCRTPFRSSIRSSFSLSIFARLLSSANRRRESPAWILAYWVSLCLLCFYKYYYLTRSQKMSNELWYWRRSEILSQQRVVSSSMQKIKSYTFACIHTYANFNVLKWLKIFPISSGISVGVVSVAIPPETHAISFLRR